MPLQFSSLISYVKFAKSLTYGRTSALYLLHTSLIIWPSISYLQMCFIKTQVTLSQFVHHIIQSKSQSLSRSLGLIVVNTILMFLILLILPESCTSIRNEMLSERFPIDLEKLKMLNRDHDATIFHEIGGVCSIETLLGSVSYCSTFHSAFFLTECSHLG